jgi:hypothetical protein
VCRPPSVNIVGNKWILKSKHRPNGSTDMHKSRLVSHAFTQQYGIDYGDTLIMVIKTATVGLVLFLAISRDWCL